MDIVLFGIQGSGKGTQGQKIAQKYNLKIFETGGALRELAKQNTALGLKIKSIIENGHLVSTEIVMEIIEDFMKKLAPGQNVLFDGIPRKADQSEAFNQLMNRLRRDYLGLLIEISRASAVKRLTARRICEKCKSVFPYFYKKNTCEKCGGLLVVRADDNLSSIENRLIAYEKETSPVIKSYQQQNKIIAIAGEQPIEKVTQDIFSALDKYFQ